MFAMTTLGQNRGGHKQRPGKIQGRRKWFGERARVDALTIINNVMDHKLKLKSLKKNLCLGFICPEK
jgi:hypothetical protein